MNTATILTQYCQRIRELVGIHGLHDAAVTVLAKTLTPEEAIGTPGRRDFPILEGKERVIEAAVMGARGQAFTDSPSEFEGCLRSVLDLPLTTNRQRAIFLATTNAMLAHLGLAHGTVHCKDNAPEQCAAEIAAAARNTAARRVGLVGFNPAIAEALVREFGPDNVMMTDLNPRNIGITKFGVTIMDGRTQTGELIQASDLVVVTGTTLVNDTFDYIRQQAQVSAKRLIIFGITAAGVCRVMNMEHWCPRAENG